jgi:hypothetical protein
LLCRISFICLGRRIRWIRLGCWICLSWWNCRSIILYYRSWTIINHIAIVASALRYITILNWTWDFPLKTWWGWSCIRSLIWIRCRIRSFIGRRGCISCLISRGRCIRCLIFIRGTIGCRIHCSIWICSLILRC